MTAVVFLKWERLKHMSLYTLLVIYFHLRITINTYFCSIINVFYQSY
jgi:hypothetical protein